MDFKKLKELSKEWDIELNRISDEYNIDIKYLKRLCQEIGFQTAYTYSEAIELVSNDLDDGLNINQIIIKYKLDEDLI